MKVPIWGRSEIEGRIICKKYGVKLHIIEKHIVEEKEIWAHQIVDESGSRSLDNIDYNESNTIHIINFGRSHFQPILIIQTEQQSLGSSFLDPGNSHIESGSDLNTQNKVNQPKSVSSSANQVDQFLQKADGQSSHKIVSNKVKSDGRSKTPTPKKIISRVSYQESNKKTLPINSKISKLTSAKKTATSNNNKLESKVLPSTRKSQQFRIEGIVQSSDQQNLQPKVAKETVSKPPIYSKRGGTGGISGQLYEINLSMQLFTRSLMQDKKHSYLASNISGLGAFDDVVLKNRLGTIFLQAKHRDNQAKGKITIDKLLRVDGDFGLNKYLEDYLVIKRKCASEEEKQDNPILSSEFENSRFIIYTSAILDEDFDQRKIDLIKEPHDFLLTKISEKTKSFKLKLDDDIVNCLANVLTEERMKVLAERFAKHIFGKSIENMMADELIQESHVLLAQEVVEVIEGESKFRDSFFSDEIKYNCLLSAFREVLYKEAMLKRKFQLTNNEITKSITEILNEPSVELISKLIGNVLKFDDERERFVIKKKFLKTIPNHLKDSLEKKEIKKEMVSDAINLIGKQELKLLEIKFPDTFGNHDLIVSQGKQVTKGERRKPRPETVAESFVKLFEDSNKIDNTMIGNGKKLEKGDIGELVGNLLISDEKSEEKLIKIDNTMIGHGKDFLLGKGMINIQGGIGGLVGNLLIPDEKSEEKLKFNLNHASLPKNAKEVFNQLKTKVSQDDELKRIKLEDYRFEISVQGFPRLSWLNREYNRSIIQEFLGKLEFFVGQAKEGEIDECIREEVAEFYKIQDPWEKKMIFLLVKHKIMEWWKDKNEKADYLTERCNYLDEAMEEIKQGSSQSELILISSILEYYIKYEGAGIDFMESSINSLGISEFLLSQSNNILKIETDRNDLSAFRIYKSMRAMSQYKDDSKFIFIKLSDSKLIQDFAVKKFKETRDLLIIECDETENNVEKLYEDLKLIINSDSCKKIIFITQGKDYLSDKFKSDFSQKYEEKKDEKNQLTDLTNESQEKLLEKEGTVIFQGKETSLGTLFTDKGSRKLISGEVLSDLVEGRKITIGSSLSTISDSDSPAYHKVMGGIDKQHLKNRKDDTFVISGINRKSLAEKLEVEENKIIEKKKIIFSKDKPFQFVVLDRENNDKVLDDFEDVCKQYQDGLSLGEIEKKLIHFIEFQNDKFIWNRYYDPRFYMDREFNRIVIDDKELKGYIQKSSQNRDIFLVGGVQGDELASKDKIACTQGEIKDKSVFILSTDNEEEEAQKILNTKDLDSFNIHWIQKKDDEFIWKRSKGKMESISNLRKEVSNDEDSNMKYKQLDIVENERFIVIADIPGMGKSTTLLSLSETYKIRNPLDWVIKINLRDCEDSIDNRLEYTNINTIVSFLSSIDTEGIEHSLTKRLLTHKLSANSEVGRILLLLDGFDEIRGNNQVKSRRQDKIIDLLKFLKDLNAKVLITTRPYAQEKTKLENTLSVLSYNFRSITDDYGQEFIKRFWKNSLKLKYDRNELSELQYKTFAKALIDKSHEVFGKELSGFIGVPLQLQMLAEAYLNNDKGCEKNREITGEAAIGKLLKDLNFCSLYRDFVDSKYQIYFEEKNRFGRTISDTDRKRLKKSYQKDHKRLAFRYYFDDGSSKNVGNFSDYGFKFGELSGSFGNPFVLFFSDDSNHTFFESKISNTSELGNLNRIGIVRISEDRKIDFVHRTFAEYFISELILDRIQKKLINPNYSIASKKKILEFLFNNILIQENYRVIRNFVNSLLPDISFSGYEEGIRELLQASNDKSIRGTQLHVASEEGLANIVRFLLKNQPDDYIDIKNSENMTALHLAAKEGKWEVVKYLVDKGADLNTPDKDGRTPIYWAAKQGEWKVVKYLVDKGADFKSPDKYGMTPIHFAAQVGAFEIVKYLVDKGDDFKSPDQYGSTPVHLAARWGNLKLVEYQ